MAAAAEFAGDTADIDLRDPAACYQVHPLTHTDQAKEDIDVFHDHEPAEKDGKIIDIFGQGQFDDNHVNRPDSEGSRLFEQLVEQPYLGAA